MDGIFICFGKEIVLLLLLFLGRLQVTEGSSTVEDKVQTLMDFDINILKLCLWVNWLLLILVSKGFGLLFLCAVDWGGFCLVGKCRLWQRKDAFGQQQCFSLLCYSNCKQCFVGADGANIVSRHHSLHAITPPAATIIIPWYYRGHLCTIDRVYCGFTWMTVFVRVKQHRNVLLTVCSATSGCPVTKDSLDKILIATQIDDRVAAAAWNSVMIGETLVLLTSVLA